MNAREVISFLNAHDAAEFYISLGWYPIPLHPGTKECKDSDWRTHIYTPEEFNPEDNIGIRLVKSSDPDRAIKLVGIDLDAPECVAVSKSFLPPSRGGWGRKTKDVSQVLYVSDFEKPVVFKDLVAGDKTLIEIRVDHQSMCPPSRHPNGEQLRWLSEVIEAPKVEAAVLYRATQLIATAALVARYYNPPGNRHDWGIALAGTLRYMEITEDEANKIFATASVIAGDGKVKDRLTEVRTTYQRGDEDPIAGPRKLAELSQQGKKFVESLRKIWGGGSGFVMSEKGDKIVPNSQENVRKALEKLHVTLSFDEFSHKMWIEHNDQSRVLEDDIMDRIWLETDSRFGFRPSRDFWDTVVKDLARRNPFHPVRDYLNSLEWDRKPRVEEWLIKYGGARDLPIVRAVGKIVLCAAVSRVMDPGCKYDELLVLESQQGWQKSTALRSLCPNDDWFSDDLPLNVDAKQIIERTSGKWIVEAAELSGMRKSQTEQLKATLSRQTDGPVRLAYARLPVEVRRQFIVIGTTNAQAYLKDSTGNRRFWPVKVGRFDVEAIKAERDQLWAEACVLVQNGESIRLSPTLYPEATKIQESRSMEDPWESLIAEALDNKGGEEQRVLPEQLWTILGIAPKDRDERSATRLTDIMQKLRFRRMTVRTPDKKIIKGWGRDMVNGLWQPGGWNGKSERD